MQQIRYSIGIDVGERSVGCAAIEFDDDGFAARALSLVSVIHDGGEDPDSGQRKVSRLAASGVARRARRLHARRRARLNAVCDLLDSQGFRTETDADTYQAWYARDLLSRGYIEDTEQRKRLLGLAVLHIARHRGWRNPWHSYERLANSEFPSVNLRATLERAAGWCEVGPQSFTTIGQAVAAVLASKGKRATIRPRGGAESPLMQEQVLASDQLAELTLILETQQIAAATANQICRATFYSAKPHVPVERVGHDSMPGMEEHLRATRATLEFQEFRIRAFVGNLRLRSTGVNRPLTRGEHDLVVSTLMEWREAANPRIADIGEVLEVKPSALNRDRLDQETLTVPFDRTSTAIESVLPTKHPLRLWWNSASANERAEWVALICDVTDAAEIDDDLVSGAVQILSEDDDAPALVEKANERLQSGRTAYSRASLSRLLERMRATGCDEYTARREEFGLAENWHEPLPTLDHAIEHPALQRVNTIVRRFIRGCTEKWGAPERVVVEHVRSAFLGPTKLQEYRGQINSNQTRNARRKTELVAAGIANPTLRDVRRQIALQRQNSACLYCGSTITMTTSQMDHIVPDSLGGANVRENLVAVCRTCNARKGKQAFVEYAAASGVPEVSVNDALERVRTWQRIDETPAQLRRLKAGVMQRLRMTAADIEGTDERSLATTAYAALEMRRRIAGTLGIDLDRVDVYRGAVTREARRAGGVDAKLRVRGADDKSRFDRRHHAIDAAVLTTLKPLTARTLAERSALRVSESEEMVADATWRMYQGKSANAVADFLLWKERVQSVADTILLELRRDRVAVTRPLRLSPRSSRAHLDSIHQLVEKDVGDTWSADEVDRIADIDAYEGMTALLGSAAKLPPDPQRLGALKQAARYKGHSVLTMFPGGGAQTLVRGGAADLGEVHHARIYAWRTKAGYGFGWIRVFAGELRPLGLASQDVLNAELPSYSASMRTANRTLRKRIATGDALQIGWIADHDEIELNPQSPSLSAGEIRSFLSELPESKWVLTGFYNSTTVSIAPALLAAEGLPARFEADEDDQRTEPERAVEAILSANRVRVALNSLLQDPSLLIIRRTSLGRPRWKSSSLPESWSPWQSAQRVLGK